MAHNNIILYLLMRAAGVPIERAAQAWRLFTLRHASITRIDLAASDEKHIIAVGAAGHIADTRMTWDNIKGADMSAWKGGAPERKKFSGRTIVLVCPVTADDTNAIDAVAAHIKSLTEFMVSGHIQVISTSSASRTSTAIAQRFRSAPQVLPDSIIEQPEAAFLQLFAPPTERSRDTIVLVAESRPLLYCLLRALHLAADEATATIPAYCIGAASITLVNVRPDGSTKVVAVGDTGHVPLV